jgi:hypothetical protein
MVAQADAASVSEVDQPELTDADEPVEDGATCDDVSSTPENDDLSLDVAFDIVKNERRRLVLQYLAEQDEPVALGELAEHIAAIENDKDVKAINSSERKRVYVGLYQCHLPKMDDADVIDSERNSNIRLGSNADQVMQYIDVDEAPSRPWERYYLALSAVGGLFVLMDGLLGLGTAGSGLVGIVVLALLGTALVQTRAA